jgi:pSer/pThr/pTyr-binding forkhead associated (FHA) protein
MGFQLVVVRGRSSLAAHRLGPGTTTAGRQEGCQLLIRSSQVSRRHCEFFEKQGHLIVKDLGSANGTLVNGKRVEGQRVLAEGDEVSIGGILFRIEKTSGAPPAQAPVSASDTAVSEPVVADEVLLEEEEPAEPIAIDIEEDGETVEAPRPAAAAQPAREEPKAPKPEAAELGEEAVADFLLSIDLDDNP